MRPRARRCSFAGTVELTDLGSETKIQRQTIDLSLYGCRVETYKPLLAGTKVRIKIAYRRDSFAAVGRAYARADGEMRIVFTRIEPNDQVVLEKWIEEQRHVEKVRP